MNKTDFSNLIQDVETENTTNLITFFINIPKEFTSNATHSATEEVLQEGLSEHHITNFSLLDGQLRISYDPHLYPYDENSISELTRNILKQGLNKIFEAHINW